MDDFLDRYHIPKLNQDQVNYPNSPKTPKEIDIVSKNLTTRESPGPDGFSATFYHFIKRKANTSIIQTIKKIKTEGSLPNSSY